MKGAYEPDIGVSRGYSVMAIVAAQTGNYPAKAGALLLTEGSPAGSINILTRGSADVLVSRLASAQGVDEQTIARESFKLFSVGPNTFLGIGSVLLNEPYSLSYRALTDDANVYALPVQNNQQVRGLVQSKPEYGAFIVSSLGFLIDNLYAAFLKASKTAARIRKMADNLAIYFWHLKQSIGFSANPNDQRFQQGLNNYNKLAIAGTPIPSTFSERFFEEDFSRTLEVSYHKHTKLDLEKIDYFRRVVALPLDARKRFFGADASLTFYACRDAAKTLSEIERETRDAFREARKAFDDLYNESDDSILSEFARVTGETREAGKTVTLLTATVDFIAKEIARIGEFYRVEFGHQSEVNNANLQRLLAFARGNETHASPRAEEGAEIDDIFALLDENAPSPRQATAVIEGVESLPNELKGAAKKIALYAEIPEERYALFMKNLELFRKMRDKFDTEPDARKIRKSVTNVFFEIYESVFKKTIQEKNSSRLFQMFLAYGFMDERLLHPQQTLDLYRIVDTTPFNETFASYNIRDWLIEIFNKRKDPSVSELGQDYWEIFRELKKRGELSDADKPAYDANLDNRLHHEVEHLFKTTQRLTSGQISVYFPILHADMITRDLERSLVTHKMVEDSVKRLLEIDFSAFHREILYRNPARNIEKEFIMKSVVPDFILMPTFGTRAIMWQELSGRNRQSKGRIVLPIFTSEDLDQFIIQTVGAFRWELCKTMLGPAWNDVTQSSITADYTDYLQFYRKNRDLSDEGKEKLKAQMQKYRNNSREIFSSDYSMWINYESKGIMRLNKVVRGILYRHCPFPKEMRLSLASQPMFVDIGNRFKNIRSKKTREIENHYHKYTKNGGILDPELEANLEFYRDL